MKTRPERIYHYRGGIERGARYDWRDGYSADDDTVARALSIRGALEA